MLPNFENMSLEYKIIPYHLRQEFLSARDTVIQELKTYRTLQVRNPQLQLQLPQELVFNIFQLLKGIYPYVPMIRNCPHMGFKTLTLDSISQKIPWLHHRNVLSQSYDEQSIDHVKFLGFTIYSDIMFQITGDQIQSFESKHTPLGTFLAAHLDALSYWIESNVDLVLQGPDNIMQNMCLNEITYLAKTADTLWRDVSVNMYDTVNALMAIWINNDERARQAYIAVQLLYAEEPQRNWSDTRRRLHVFLECYHSQSTKESLAIDSQFIADIDDVLLVNKK